MLASNINVLNFDFLKHINIIGLEKKKEIYMNCIKYKAPIFQNGTTAVFAQGLISSIVLSNLGLKRNEILIIEGLIIFSINLFLGGSNSKNLEKIQKKLGVKSFEEIEKEIKKELSKNNILGSVLLSIISVAPKIIGINPNLFSIVIITTILNILYEKF